MRPGAVRGGRGRGTPRPEQEHRTTAPTPLGRARGDRGRESCTRPCGGATSHREARGRPGSASGWPARGGHARGAGGHARSLWPRVPEPSRPCDWPAFAGCTRQLPLEAPRPAPHSPVRRGPGALQRSGASGGPGPAVSSGPAACPDPARTEDASSLTPSGQSHVRGAPGPDAGWEPAGRGPEHLLPGLCRVT